MERQVTVIPATKTARTKGRQKQASERKLRVAAYCRVSTEQEEQENSFRNQVDYYTRFIGNHPEYELAGIYADEGISGTNTKNSVPDQILNTDYCRCSALFLRAGRFFPVRPCDKDINMIKSNYRFKIK